MWSRKRGGRGSECHPLPATAVVARERRDRPGSEWDWKLKIEKFTSILMVSAETCDGLDSPIRFLDYQRHYHQPRSRQLFYPPWFHAFSATAGQPAGGYLEDEKSVEGGGTNRGSKLSAGSLS